LIELHATPEGGAAWSSERDRLTNLLIARRDTFIEACQRKGVAVNPSHDGFFAWYECSDPVAVAEACADQHVYLVPLSGGVRIGLCAIPESKVERVAEALAKAAEAVE
jgi:aromatic-amino-acid transaminase